MSPIPKIVVWKSDKEIDNLFSLFYDKSSPDKVRKAVNLVLAYSTRGPIPHSVESTALIADAMLQDNGSNGPLAIRSAYSMALVRFVNGLVDPLQQGQYALPIYSLAAELQLPSYFVDLRHTATHEILPSLETLRDVSERALDWLRAKYWSVHRMDENTISSEQHEKISNEVKDLFREWRRLRREDPLKELKKGDQSKEAVSAWKIIEDIKTAINDNEELVMDVMLRRNVLIVNGDFESGAAVLFRPFFQGLNDEKFVSRLACYGINVIMALQSGKENEKNASQEFHKNFSEIWSEWVKYFLTYQAKGAQKFIYSDEAISAIIESCLEHPNKYLLSILQSCLTLKSDAIKPELQRLVKDIEDHLSNAEQNLVTEESIPNKRDITQIVDEVDDLKSQLKMLKNRRTGTSSPQTLVNSKWNLAENWTPRPLGVL